MPRIFHREVLVLYVSNSLITRSCNQSPKKVGWTCPCWFSSLCFFAILRSYRKNSSLISCLSWTHLLWEKLESLSIKTPQVRVMNFSTHYLEMCFRQFFVHTTLKLPSARLWPLQDLHNQLCIIKSNRISFGFYLLSFVYLQACL